MRDYYEREAIDNFNRKEKEEKTRKANRLERIICVALGAILVILICVGVGEFLNNTPEYTIKNERYISKELTPDEPETFVIFNMSREAILANGWTIIDGPDETTETKSSHYWDDECNLPIANPEYINPYETPDVSPWIRPEA